MSIGQQLSRVGTSTTLVPRPNVTWIQALADLNLSGSQNGLLRLDSSRDGQGLPHDRTCWTQMPRPTA
jgi:hypothetical protein